MNENLKIPGLQSMQCGVIGPGTTSIGFKFNPTEVFLAKSLTNFCFMTNPNADETRHYQDNNQVYIQRGSKYILVHTDNDYKVYAELTEDGLLRFTDKDGNLTQFNSMYNVFYIALNIETK